MQHMFSQEILEKQHQAGGVPAPCGVSECRLRNMLLCLNPCYTSYQLNDLWQVPLPFFCALVFLSVKWE